MTPAPTPLDDTRLVIDHLQKAVPQVVTAFDGRYEGELQAFGEWLGPCYRILGGYALTQPTDDEPLSTCVQLLWNATGSIMAAIELVRAGQTLQPPILLRRVVIMPAAAIHLDLTPHDVPTF